MSPATEKRELLITTPAPAVGLVVLATPAVPCGGCQQMRALFVNVDGRTLCVTCAVARA